MSVFFVFETVQNMEVTTEKQFEIGKALDILNRQNQTAIQEGLNMTCSYSLCNDDQIVYQSFLAFPKDSFNLYSVIEEEILNDYTNEEERDLLLNWLQTFLKQPAVEKTSKKQKKDKPKKEKTKQKPILSKKKVRLIVLSILLLASSLSLVYFIPKVINSQSQSQSKSEPKLDFQHYFDNEEYEKALQVNDSSVNIVKVVNKLVESQEFERLKTINKKFPSKEGSFELAFFEEDWQTVIETPLNDLSKEKQVMISHAYIQLNQLDQALILNDILQSDLLLKQIAIAYLQQGNIKEAENLQIKLNDDKLAELILEAKAYIKLIKRYEDEKDNDSADNWKQILKNLGKEQQNDGEK